MFTPRITGQPYRITAELPANIPNHVSIITTHIGEGLADFTNHPRPDDADAIQITVLINYATWERSA